VSIPEIQSRKTAWSRALLGIFIALFGLVLAGGGAYLTALGGSWYYVVVGAMFMAAGYLLIKRKYRRPLHLHRRVRLYLCLDLLGDRTVGLAIDSASCRTLRPPRSNDSDCSPRSTRRPDGMRARWD